MDNKEKASTDKLVGVHIAPHIFEYLTSYCYFKGITKSIPLRTIIQNWYVEKSNNLSLGDVCKGLIEKIQTQWETRLSILAANNVSKKEIAKEKLLFIQTTQKNMRQKGIPKIIIDNVIKALR